MKVVTSTVPVAEPVKRALSTKAGRASLLDFINARAAGTSDARLRLVDGDKVVELTAEPVDSLLKNGAL
jgi:hypothetical protein